MIKENVALRFAEWFLAYPHRGE